MAEVEAQPEKRNLPVVAAPAERHELDSPAGGALPTPAVAAVGGFVAGVAVVTVVRVLRALPRAARFVLRRGRRGRRLDVQGTRSFLVDVHLLKR